MAEFGAPSIGMSNSRTISIEETTKRKFSFSVEDLARSDAKAPESPRQTLNDSLAARAIEGDRFVAQAASESCTPSTSSADKRNQSKDLHPAEASPSQPIKKARSLFSVEQVYALEQCFRRQKYLGSKERLELALALNMSETQVKTWFQNRRMKMKRKRAESVERYAKMSFLNNVAHGMFPQQQGYHGYQPPLPPPPPSSCLAPPRVLCNDLYQLDYPCTPAPWSFPPNPSQPTPPAYWGYHPDQFSGLR